jgi:hypothetical protein
MASIIRCNAVARLVDPGTRLVRFDSLHEIHEFIVRDLCFEHVDTRPYGPPRGLQISYIRDDVQIRIKTHGNSHGYRRGQAHLSVASWDGTLEYRGEWAKFTASGAAMVDPSPRHGQGLCGDNYLGASSGWRVTQDMWAGATHFDFRPQTLVGGELLRVGHA